MQYYIRFGNIPKDEKSSIYFHGVDTGKKEIGVSVFNACKINGVYHIVIPNPCTGDTLDDIVRFMKYSSEPFFLVTGKKIGLGTDNEPLIINVKIIKDIRL